MKKTYYKREYYDNKKGRFVTKVSTDIGKLVAKNEVFRNSEGGRHSP